VPTIPASFEFNHLWFADVQDAAPLNLEPKTWQPGNVLIGKSWVWHSPGGTKYMWTLEADTQNLGQFPTPTGVNTNQRINAGSLAEAGAIASSQAVAWMDANFKKPGQAQNWPSLADWTNAGGHWYRRND